MRVVVLTGAGRAFCAGGDVNFMAELVERGDSEEFARLLGAARRVILAIRHMTKPVIASINGPAAGAGFNLALACDLRIASSDATFAQSFVKIGFHPDWGGTYFLPRVVGIAKACELIFTGDAIDANEALRLGIVNSVVAPEALMNETYKLAKKIAAGPPVAIQLAKRSIYHNQDADLRSALEFETFAQNITRETEDSKEGVKAFVEKREAVFKGR